ncbi:E3 ubiquitin-protein ligase MARCHF3-like [Periplaneta americana]|uniref:E3 ubiquitin-protein ligase MARCHF3-like n=1 Tax=Periplaneta americana TaxID=6978 RepID=UPI0037E9BD98
MTIGKRNKRARSSASLGPPKRPSTTSVHNEQPACRICQESDPVQTLISPCRCKGSVGFVHQKCLETWLQVSSTTRCELCHYEYQVEVARKYRLCPSIFVWLVYHADHRHIFFDFMTGLILTPLVVAGIYLCVVTSSQYRQDNEIGALNLTVSGIGLLCGTILAAYLIWLIAAIRHHIIRWHEFWTSSYTVRIVPASPSTRSVRSLASEENSTDLSGSFSDED